MLDRHQSRKDRKSASPNSKVMEAAPVGASPELEDPQPSTLGAVTRRELLQLDYAVGDALELDIGSLGGSVVEEKHRAALADEELL